MTFEEFKQWIDSNPDNPRARSFLTTLEAATPDKAETVLAPQLDAATVQTWLDSKDAFQVLQPRLDKAKNEALARFKEAELPKLQQQFFETEYQKKHPPTSEEAKALAEMKQKFAELERKEKHSAIREKMLQYVSEKKLPIKILDLVSIDEEDTTMKRLEDFYTVFEDSTNARSEERFKGIKPEPRAGATPTAAKFDAKAPIESQVEALMAAAQTKGA